MNTNGTVVNSSIERFLKKVRHSAALNKIVQLESSAGWPIPRRRSAPTGQAAVFLTVPLIRTKRREDGKGIYLFAPHAEITVHWPTGKVVAFHDYAFDSPWPQQATDEHVDVFPRPGLPERADELTQRIKAAYGYYDELLHAWVGDQRLAPAWWTRFATTLSPLLEPGLLPFYRALGPKFFARIVPDGRPAPATSTNREDSE